MMNYRSVSMTWIVLVLAASVLSGCTSYRYTSTLKPSGDRTIQYGDVRLSLSGFTYEKPGIEPAPPVINQRAMALYPNVFTDDRTGLPVHIDIKRSYNDTSFQFSSFLTGFCTLGMVPFPGAQKSIFTMNATVMDSQGETLLEQQTVFEIHRVIWASALPWGLLPVPGSSDLPRDSVMFSTPVMGGDVDPYTKTNTYAAECISEAIVQSIKTADQARLAAAHKERRSRMQEITVDGRRYWGFLTLPSFIKGKPADTVNLLVYQDFPRKGAKQFDKAIVARRDDTGRWYPVNGYLRHAGALTAVSCLVENNVPVRAVVRTPETPPLEDFIDTPDLSGIDRAEVLRWSNNVLLDAKNRSMEKVLREDSREALLALATRIERSILDLSEQAERAKDRAQAKVEKGEGDPGPDRELSILCRQRIEILKPVLAAMKDAVARKQ